DSDNRVVAAYLDSADVRLASLGFVPFQNYSGATGQWAKLLVNAILWVWPGMPAVSVTAPDTGSIWNVGTSHDITWTAANGPITRDSIVYSTDNGATWSFLDKYTGSRTSFNWNPIPNSPSTDCYVRVFTWNTVGTGFGTSGKFEIQVGGGIEQPENDALPLAFALHRAGPNPLVSGTLVRYDLPRPAQVELRIYDVTGALVRRLVEGTQTAGYQHAYWNGCDDQGRTVAPGVYYCRFSADDYSATQKVVVRR
ncbi:T9SS type A sorting domain-containing protein, partial [candidate division WOR-3 bacterium]|nr:T9SS type A sorting domain-containing protein [candidate division WOR-3 bacterium]